MLEKQTHHIVDPAEEPVAAFPLADNLRVMLRFMPRAIFLA
jgi:hypothetical protein